MRNGDDLDRILGEDEEMLPSAGFTASVMDAVRREATTPPPIPFPWKRALPGLAAAVVALVLALVQVSAAPIRGAAAPPRLLAWLSSLAPVLEGAVAGGGHWVALALLLTYASVKLSVRLGRLA